MNIIDTACFYGRWPFRARGETDVQAMLDRAGRNGVDTLLVSCVQSIFYQDSFEGELELHRAIGGRARVHHVATVNPAAPGWQRDFQTALEEFAPKAVKVFPSYHGYSLLGPELAELAAAAAENNLPLIVCLRVEDERVTHMVRQAPVPMDVVGQFLGIFRDQSIVLSNVSFGEMMAVRPCLLAREGVWLDTAGLKFTSFPLEKLLAHYPADRFLFGSQFPLYVQRGLLNEVTQDELPGGAQRAILRDNAAALFGLEAGA